METKKTEKKEIVTMRQLLECGVHFGHQTKRWNPKMKKYIFTARNGIHVIDLQQSLHLIKVAYEFVKDIASKGGTIMFVGTKKQAQESIHVEAERCGMPYVHHRWLGGTLTNNVTLRQSITKLKGLETMVKDGTMSKLSNKEASQKTKKLTRLNFYLAGIKDMISLPQAIFIVDTKKEQLAIKEAQRLKIPIIGVVDTNTDPTEVQYPIPANDDAIRAIKLLCTIMANAIMEGKPSGLEDEIDELEKEMLESVDKSPDAKKDEAASEDPKAKKENTKEANAAPKSKVASAIETVSK
ncbi:MAG: small subunit ribosomal protein S2 [Candidatus Marinamargulisbacteria bacterium]|jgi:small subunit ribosomal protein S2